MRFREGFVLNESDDALQDDGPGPLAMLSFSSVLQKDVPRYHLCTRYFKTKADWSNKISVS